MPHTTKTSSKRKGGAPEERAIKESKGLYIVNELPHVRWNAGARREDALAASPDDSTDSFRWGHLSKLTFYVHAMETHLGRRRDPDHDLDVAPGCRYTGLFAYDLDKIIAEATSIRELMRLPPRQR